MASTPNGFSCLQVGKTSWVVQSSVLSVRRGVEEDEEEEEERRL